MDIAEGVNDEHVNVGRCEEQIANEAQYYLTQVALTVDAERNDLGEDDHSH